MKFLTLIDQRAAIAAGIDAPNSRQMIHLDPKALSAPAREYLSKIVDEGHDLTRAHHLKVLEPTAEALMNALENLAFEKAAAEQKEQTEMVEYWDGLLRAPPVTRTVKVKLHEGEVQIWSYSGLEVSYQQPAIAAANSPNYNRLPPEFAESLKATREAAEAQTDMARREAFEAARPTLEAKEAELAAEKEAEKAAKEAEAAEYRAYYALLPKTVRERHSDGFAAEEEIVDLIGKMILAEAGLTEAGHAFDRCAGTETLDVLTDEQFSALLAAKQRAPTGSEVVPVTAFDREGECFRILVTWSRGGIEVDALVAPGDSWLA
jgi:hypothetical protein